MSYAFLFFILFVVDVVSLASSLALTALNLQRGCCFRDPTSLSFCYLAELSVEFIAARIY